MQRFSHSLWGPYWLLFKNWQSKLRPWNMILTYSTIAFHRDNQKNFKKDIWKLDILNSHNKSECLDKALQQEAHTDKAEKGNRIEESLEG